MSNSIEKKLREKGIKCSEQELMMLEHQWKAIQQLKQGVEKLGLNEADIGVVHQPGGVYRGKTAKYENNL
ncbi:MULTISPECIES: hypothetical protein [Geobacillus]|uniref:Uncharacterized protein n=4 Tax=Geobacillus TaxID=129337 RepID=A0A1C3D3G9_GEOTH|nr:MULTISPECIES: hypothetical protein [Geobacillus]MED0653099.1 hypothetical protein [Anoxybacillus geothermalis]QOR85509.1 hypothetical protein IMZ17_07370 [Geobacillus stearothermophilus]AEV18927.1 hypothetical protein GTCCBUS3UF5_16150 [Geobacillus thermoleovorans CCB_US3_UF5]AMV10626.1 hypothetical protein GT3570_06640 [Geobacillus thermoleovorans]AOL34232.1 hypothetical protein BGM21_06730 [Geobacillus thermoleovorans]